MLVIRHKKGHNQHEIRVKVSFYFAFVLYNDLFYNLFFKIDIKLSDMANWYGAQVY